MFIGVDIGAKGAICALNKEGQIITLEVMPLIDKELNLKSLFSIFHNHRGAFVVLEKVSAMPKNGAVSMFKFGRTYGQTEALVSACGISYELARPAVWQKVMHEGIEKKIDVKKRSLMAAQRLFPNESFLATSRSKVPHDGLVDAALIAEYCRRKFS